jgi:hypothetical protein
MIPLFYNPTILQTFDKWISNTFLENLIKGMFMSPIILGNVYKSFTPLFETLSNYGALVYPLF